MVSNFKDWLLEQYLDWQRKLRRTASITEFSEYLGFGKMTVGRWLNGTAVPDYGNAFKIGLKLGIEVFDALDMQRPDETLFMMWQNWHLLSPEQQWALRQQVDAFLGENAPSAAHTPY